MRLRLSIPREPPAAGMRQLPNQGTQPLVGLGFFPQAFWEAGRPEIYPTAYRKAWAGNCPQELILLFKFIITLPENQKAIEAN